MKLIKRIYLCLVQRITTHIKQLLLLNDHVIIPDIGLFKLQAQLSIHVPDEHFFSPRKKQLHFQTPPLLSDDSLMRSYMQADHLSEQAARAALQQDVEEMERRLNKQGVLLLEQLGILKKEDDTLIFYPDDRSMSFDSDAFGLPSFHLPVISEKKEDFAEIKASTTEMAPATVAVDLPEKEHKPTSNRLIYLPINRALLRIVAMIVILLGLFLLLSTPVNNVSRSSYTAGFNPSELFSHEEHPLEEESYTSAERTTESTAVPLEAEDATETTTSAEAETPPLEEKKEEGIAFEQAKQGRYYIIIASFDTKREAERFIEKVDPLLFTNIGIVYYQAYVRVYANKYENRSEAVASLQSVRTKERFKDAWLFVGR